MIIGLDPSLTVVAEAATGEEAVERFIKYRPDVTLMDLQLPGMNGLQAIHAIRGVQADARIIVLTMYAGDTNIHHALRAGAVGYLLKDSVPEDLIRIIHDVHTGKRAVPLHLETMLTQHDAKPALTAREIEVLKLREGDAQQGDWRNSPYHGGNRPRSYSEHLSEVECPRQDRGAC